MRPTAKAAMSSTPPRSRASVHDLAISPSGSSIRACAVAVGGFDQKHVGRAMGRGVEQHGVVVTAQVAGKHQALALRAPPAACSSTMAEPMMWPASRKVSVSGRSSSATGASYATLSTSGSTCCYIGLGVERLGRLVLGEALLVGIGGFFLLQLGRVEQHDAEQVGGGSVQRDAAPEAVVHQLGQVAAVVDVGVGEDNQLHVGRGQRQGLAVAQAQLLQALEQAAVDQQLVGLGAVRSSSVSRYLEPVTQCAAPRNCSVTSIKSAVKQAQRKPPTRVWPFCRTGLDESHAGG